MTVNVAQPANQATLVPTIVTFGVSDPDVLLALSEYPEGQEKTHFLTTALKVGVLALKAARGTLDSDTLHRESDRLMSDLEGRLNNWRAGFEERVTGALSHYFDPKSGTFIDRVERLTKSDGELATVMRQQVQDAQTVIERVFDTFIGENSKLMCALDPTGENHLVGALQRALDCTVQAQNVSILKQFSLDNKEGALVRFLGELTTRHGDLNQALSRDMQAVVSEFSLDRDDSALSRLVQRVEASQERVAAELSLDAEDSALQRLHRLLQEHQKTVLKQQMELSARLDTVIQSMNARREEAAKSTRHGFDFETTLATHLRGLAQATGDILSETGTTTGLVPNCKVGDYVLAPE